MQAYVDESGGKGEGKWLTLVGLIAKAEDWAAFSDLWRSLLDIPPAVSAWHMKDAAHFAGEFSGWARATRDARLWLLASAVNDFSITALHCSVDLDAHKEFMAPIGNLRAPRKSRAARIGKILHEPYWLCFHSMIMAVCYELIDHETKDRFEIIFDEHSILGPRVKVWYPVIRAYMEPHEQEIMPVEPLFRDDTKFVPLQCADILAWVLHRELDDRQHTFGWIPNAMHGLVWSGHRQIFDRGRLKGIREKAIREPISAETYRQYSELLGL
jgi:hypothetical protein